MLYQLGCHGLPHTACDQRLHRLWTVSARIILARTVDPAAESLQEMSNTSDHWPVSPRLDPWEAFRVKRTGRLRSIVIQPLKGRHPRHPHKGARRLESNPPEPDQIRIGLSTQLSFPMILSPRRAIMPALSMPASSSSRLRRSLLEAGPRRPQRGKAPDRMYRGV